MLWQRARVGTQFNSLSWLCFALAGGRERESEKPTGGTSQLYSKAQEQGDVFYIWATESGQQAAPQRSSNENEIKYGS
jgi:hypothetical protein